MTCAAREKFGYPLSAEHDVSAEHNGWQPKRNSPVQPGCRLKGPLSVEEISIVNLGMTAGSLETAAAVVARRLSVPLRVAEL